MKKIIVLVAVIFPALAFADAKTDIANVDKATQACLNNPDNYSTMGMDQCLNTGFVAADKVLNSLYDGIVANLKKPTGDSLTDQNQAETLKRLVASERAWIAFRDADSSLAGTEMLGGSGEGTTILSTSYDMTKARVLEIDQVFNGTN